MPSSLDYKRINKYNCIHTQTFLQAPGKAVEIFFLLFHVSIEFHLQRKTMKAKKLQDIILRFKSLFTIRIAINKI
jgi:hypothetical protein